MTTGGGVGSGSGEKETGLIPPAFQGRKGEREERPAREDGIDVGGGGESRAGADLDAVSLLGVASEDSALRSEVPPAAEERIEQVRRCTASVDPKVA